MLGRLALILAAAAALLPALAPPAARAQSARAEILLDASKSMNDPAGNGGTRLDAAKQAVRTLLNRLPDGARLGLRVYGSKVSEATRAAGCRDTEAAIAVGPLEKAGFQSAVDGLQGKGRTPIGASLLATPGDLGSAAGRRTVVLVSDGGDNCAPPDPCAAARQVARRGVDLSISVVGLQVNERVRRQLQCIAKAGGGTYVDVTDAGKLGDELAAALARAFREYVPSGTRVTGGTATGQAAALGTGLFQDTLSPGDERFYAVDVPRGRRLLASVTAIPSYDATGQGALTTELFDPSDRRVGGNSAVLYGRAAGEAGRVVSESVKLAAFAGAPDTPPGRYVFRVAIETQNLQALPIPVELGLQLLEPGETPALVRGAGRVPGPKATATPSATPAPVPKAGGAGGRWAAVGAALVLGLAVGLASALVLTRRRAT